jgi:hypothetical protein
MKKRFTIALSMAAFFSISSTVMAQTIEVHSIDSRPSSIGSSEYFTGESIVVPLLVPPSTPVSRQAKLPFHLARVPLGIPIPPGKS